MQQVALISQENDFYLIPLREMCYFKMESNKFKFSGSVGHALNLNFHQISQVYKEFCKSLFSRSERLTYYVLKYDNFKSIEVHG